MLQSRPPKLKWPRSQQFVLSEKGVEAEAAYRATIVASRDQGGRASFDAARSAWAAGLQIEADDGMYLGELSHGPIRASQIVESVESSGKTQQETNAALERLFRAGLLSLAPEASTTP